MMAAKKPMRFRLLLDHTGEKSHVADLMAKFQVSSVGTEQQMRFLSGGNQQKAILAKWLQLAPKLLLLDEPTQGVDIAAKANLYALLDEAVGRGTSVIISSSDVQELSQVCDRVVVLVDGSVRSTLTGSELDEPRLLAAMHAA
jgi:ribose transport system ATP-binding protein